MHRRRDGTVIKVTKPQAAGLSVQRGSALHHARGHGGYRLGLAPSRSALVDLGPPGFGNSFVDLIVAWALTVIFVSWTLSEPADESLSGYQEQQKRRRHGDYH